MREQRRKEELRELGYNVHAFDQHIRAVEDKDERDYIRSLQTGFMDKDAHAAAPYAPRLLCNDQSASENVLFALEAEFLRCERFDILVAFVTSGGITVLMNTLLELERRGVPGRILVSTYLGFNDPDALEKLRGFSNVDVRIYEGPLHSKGYLFDSQGVCTLVIGSSNLTQGALLANAEWNLMVKSYEHGAICDATKREFERLWGAQSTKRLTTDWLARYRAGWVRPQARSLPQPISDADHVRVVPNKMQAEALRNLKRLRSEGATRALLISATGTGKTYLAAFDVAEVRPRRMLFVVHRERIAKDAMRSFGRIIANRTMGTYVGNERRPNADYLFCTVQSLARHLDEFGSRAFDYVVFDEAHHVGAGSYQRIAEHFEPRFTLGMTATPNRNDDFNVYDFFDNNIAYQITLQRAQEADMLAPFHYFGIHDLQIDGQEIDDHTDFGRLTSRARVDHVVEQLERYAVDKMRRGLVFCSRRDEAHRLAQLFNERGYRSVALDGASSDEIGRAHV